MRYFNKVLQRTRIYFHQYSRIYEFFTKGTHRNGKKKANASLEASWKSLFHFTTASQYKYLAIAVALSILSGLVVPFQAFFLGKLFLALTSFGAGLVGGEILLDEIIKYSIFLCSLGAGSWIVSTFYFASWLFFGELQGQNARLHLFHSLLEKDMMWYDLRKNGIEALMPGIQM